jgi:hypothetical protein
MKRCIIILKWRKCTMNLSIRVEIFKEDDVYVALSPELNVQSVALYIWVLQNRQDVPPPGEFSDWSSGRGYPQ